MSFFVKSKEIFDLTPHLSGCLSSATKKLGSTAMRVFELSADLAQDTTDLLHALAGQETYEQLLSENSQDIVTQTLTRRGLYKAVSELHEHTGMNEFIGFFVDVEGLGETNNEHSQAMGDHLLTVAGWTTKRLFALPTDMDGIVDVGSLTGRWGGDEFVALLPVDYSLNESMANQVGFSQEFNTIRRKAESRANIEVSELLTADNEAMSDKIYRSLTTLHEAGINKINFRYDIGSICFTGDGKDCIEDALDDFMAQHGSKYVCSDGVQNL